MGSNENRRNASGLPAYSGWTPEQSDQFRDLSARYALVAKAYGQTLRPPDVTPEQIQNCQRFVGGDSALQATVANLRSITGNQKLDAAGKKAAAQNEFSNIADLDEFVRGIQKEHGITDKGVRKLPLLDEYGSEVYGNLYDHVTHRLSDVTRAISQKDPAVPYSEAARERAAALTQVAIKLDDLPDRLAKLADGDFTPDQKQKMAREQLLQFIGASQTAYSVERDLETYDYSARVREDHPTPEQGFLSSAWSRVKDVAKQALDKAKDLVTPGGETPRQRYGPASMMHVSNPEMKTNLYAAPAVTYDTPGPLDGTRTIKPASGVEAGEAGQEVRKGPGFSAAGQVDEIKHDGDKIELGYTIRGNRQSIRIADSDPLAASLSEMQPGDNFKLSISRDAQGRENTVLEDPTRNQVTQSRDDGRVEKKELDLKPQGNEVAR